MELNAFVLGGKTHTLKCKIAMCVNSTKYVTRFPNQSTEGKVRASCWKKGKRNFINNAIKGDKYLDMCWEYSWRWRAALNITACWTETLAFTHASDWQIRPLVSYPAAERCIQASIHWILVPVLRFFSLHSLICRNIYCGFICSWSI